MCNVLGVMITFVEIAGIFALASAQALIHAIFPECFTTSTTQHVTHIQKLLETSGCHVQSSEI
ncbi:unnamed protein product [marine sediment metagenome]|uniref:Uncharacterized protein n=1 Tax=marine sediment metagenome TaxID=412755 RepID=X1ATD1_9ZZZZ